MMLWGGLAVVEPSRLVLKDKALFPRSGTVQYFECDPTIPCLGPCWFKMEQTG